jgi:hypothetical protein
MIPIKISEKFLYAAVIVWAFCWKNTLFSAKHKINPDFQEN